MESPTVNCTNFNICKWSWNYRWVLLKPYSSYTRFLLSLNFFAKFLCIIKLIIIGYTGLHLSWTDFHTPKKSGLSGTTCAVAVGTILTHFFLA